MLNVDISTIFIILFFYVHAMSVIFSLYVHRYLFHNSIIFNKSFEKILRFLMWFGPGIPGAMSTAIHRNHHVYADKPGDIFSPIQNGFKKVILIRYFKTLYFYLFFKEDKKTPKNSEFLKKYNVVESKDFFNTYPKSGRLLFVLTNTILFGYYGILFVVLFYCIEMFNGIIFGDGINHMIGYRNFNTNDNSHNFLPLAIFVGGEELHNNHHKDPRNANFAKKWWEFDIGYFYLKIFILLGIAKERIAK